MEPDTDSATEADGDTAASSVEDVKQVNLRLTSRAHRNLKFLAAAAGVPVQRYLEGVIDDLARTHAEIVTRSTLARAAKLEQEAAELKQEAVEFARSAGLPLAPLVHDTDSAALAAGPCGDT